ncbi:hypothetical protein MAR_025644 [Mya arenaria]|uniref:Uncharacterized protein n=1 Tax=Mya arenaria TaxID=6604 RepID=A0ABY7EST4_MYAAR|nr:hypothetical protein MAR_025644 [Mya arenaria]
MLCDSITFFTLHAYIWTQFIIFAYSKSSCDKCVWEKCEDSGECIDGCKENHWGPHCNGTCSESCNLHLCDRTTGTCLTFKQNSQSEQFGPLEHYCLLFRNEESKARYMTGRKRSIYTITRGMCVCDSLCNEEVCLDETGLCKKGCSEGFYCVKQCENKNVSCIDCELNKNQCSCSGRLSCIPCPEHCSEEACANNGDCLSDCAEGWFGLKCEHKCNETLENCEVCSQSGQTCQTCTEGYFPTIYGRCEQCPSSCPNQECNVTNGHCIQTCHWTKYGQFCNKMCNNTCAKNHTSHVCDSKDGRCLHGCIKGFYGSHCEHSCSDIDLHCEQCVGRGDVYETCFKCQGGFEKDSLTLKCSNESKIDPTSATTKSSMTSNHSHLSEETRPSEETQKDATFLITTACSSVGSSLLSVTGFSESLQPHEEVQVNIEQSKYEDVRDEVELGELVGADYLTVVGENYYAEG